jgi:hypothetical protein
MDINTLKKWFTKTNLYYAGTVVCALITLVLIGFIYSSQTEKNLKASLILADAEGIIADIETQQLELKSLVSEYVAILPENFNTIINPTIRLNDLTRYFDSLEQQYRQNGQFRINTLNYGTTNNPDFIDVSLGLETTEENLLNLLSFIESTGFNNDKSRYLFEVLNISFAVPTVSEEEVDFDSFFSSPQVQEPIYTVTLQLRIYSFQSNLTPTD